MPCFAATTTSARRRSHMQRGFTLVEVLVAIFIMAILAAMAWRGIDALIRTRDGALSSSNATLALSSAIQQWQQDLDQIQESTGVPALRFDGAALRLTRRSTDGLLLVVWTVQNGTLYRWASPPVTRIQDLQEWWLRTQQWSGLRNGALAILDNVQDWQVYYYHGGDNTWSNAQSTGNLRVSRSTASDDDDDSSSTSTSSTTTTSSTSSSSSTDTSDADTAEALPDGVRLVLSLPQGVLTRDTILQEGL
jgi:general secretion pathway protein J